MKPQVNFVTIEIFRTHFLYSCEKYINQYETSVSHTNFHYTGGRIIFRKRAKKLHLNANILKFHKYFSFRHTDDEG